MNTTNADYAHDVGKNEDDHNNTMFRHCMICAARIQNGRGLSFSIDGNTKFNSNHDWTRDDHPYAGGHRSIICSKAVTELFDKHLSSSSSANVVKDCPSQRSPQQKIEKFKSLSGGVSGKAQSGIVCVVCEHQRVVATVIMFRSGERYSHVLAALAKVLEHFGLDESYQGDVVIGYDVGCKLSTYLKREGEKVKLHHNPKIRKVYDVSRLVNKMVVGSLHSYMHQPSCRRMYGNQWNIGVGLDDKEGVERLWAWMKSRFLGPSKEMAFWTRFDYMSNALRWVHSR
jgi:hypothetical protein